MHSHPVVAKYKSSHEKTFFLHMGTKGADQLRGNHAADEHLCFHYIDSTIPLLPSTIPLLSKSEISSLLSSSVAEHPGLCQT